MTSTVPARDYHTRQTHFIRQTFTYSDAGIDTSVKWRNGLPANAFITGSKVYVHTVFNAATTNVFTVGTNGPTTCTNIVSAGDVNEASAQMFNVEGVGVLDTSTPLDIYTKFAQTGTAATTGKATVVIFYCPAEEPYR